MIRAGTEAAAAVDPVVAQLAGIQADPNMTSSTVKRVDRMTLSSSLRATDSLRGFIGDVKMIRTCPERHPGTNLRPTTWRPLSAVRAGGTAGLSAPLPGGAGELRPKPLDGCKPRQAFERIPVVRGRLEHSPRFAQTQGQSYDDLIRR